MNGISGGSITIRESQVKDAKPLMRIDRLVWNSRNSPQIPVWKSRTHYLRNCPPENQLVAEYGGEVIGCVGWRPPTMMYSNSHVAELYIAVHPGYQSLGVGRKLMEAAKQYTLRRGIKKLRLRVLSTNDRAIGFYARCGFAVEGRLEREYQIDGKFVDDILMGLWLL
ncbi:GNAT family N-acetyltransferase [Saccharibacillus sp. CPCC 101409]|uniref:GNAT family N-acetyltransferase n=1 Tax=Saccharibacillus sp. CPCC 101409 TaxID=3058041 RepID=UPI002671F8A8|nr:GNAT family N-acetyltransferase [Saccharibacillus sp. CPCC 101409]MDO3410165.1 GNAT family N-acetyltransferase [Saccharibacillus sp. CPCC 101409]